MQQFTRQTLRMFASSTRKRLFCSVPLLVVSISYPILVILSPNVCSLLGLGAACRRRKAFSGKAVAIFWATRVFALWLSSSMSSWAGVESKMFCSTGTFSSSSWYNRRRRGMFSVREPNRDLRNFCATAWSKSAAERYSVRDKKNLLDLHSTTGCLLQ